MPEATENLYYVHVNGIADHTVPCNYEQACILAERESFMKDTIAYVTEWGYHMPAVIYLRGKRYDPLRWNGD